MVLEHPQGMPCRRGYRHLPAPVSGEVGDDSPAFVLGHRSAPFRGGEAGAGIPSPESAEIASMTPSAEAGSVVCAARPAPRAALVVGRAGPRPPSPPDQERLLLAAARPAASARRRTPAAIVPMPEETTL